MGPSQLLHRFFIIHCYDWIINQEGETKMFNKKTGSILTLALIVGVLGVAGVAMAAQGPSGMPCADPAVRQQMLDSNVKTGIMTQEQADQMQKNMNQMMTVGPQGNAPAPGK